MTREKPTSKHGYHTYCDHCRINLVWIDTTDGHRPGLVFCGEACHNEHHN